MITIRNEHFIKFADDKQTSVVFAEIYVDTVDELPETDGVSGKILNQGSIAYVVNTGGLYVLSGNGKWYESEGKS